MSEKGNRDGVREILGLTHKKKIYVSAPFPEIRSSVHTLSEVTMVKKGESVRPGQRFFHYFYFLFLFLQRFICFLCKNNQFYVKSKVKIKKT